MAARRPDGSVVFRVGVTNVPAFRSFVLGFLDHAEILGPPGLRDDMVAWLTPAFRRQGSARMAKASAADRLGRLLAIVPWVAAHDGPQVAEVCRRFGVGEKELLEDLELLVHVRGLPVHPRRADRRGRGRRAGVDPDGRLFPPAAAAESPGGAGPGVGRLGPAVGARCRSRRGPGHRPGQAGERARGRSRRRLRRRAGSGHARPCCDAVRQAVDRHQKVELDYYSFGRDGHSTRVVAAVAGLQRQRTVVPVSVVRAGGRGAAVPGRSHQPGRGAAGPIRAALRCTGRLDRHPYHPGPDDPLVVLDLDPPAHWVAEHYPNEGVEVRPDAVLRVALRTSQKAWLERLLLRGGPDIRVVEGDGTVAAEAADQILGRYRR